MRIPYGFTADDSGRITIDKTQAKIVQMIYSEYINGSSLGGLVKKLEGQCIPSQSGNAQWGRAAIDKLLSNSKYVPYIISIEQYTAVQFEKAARSNQEVNDDGTTKRKATRYHSPNGLSGLLVCAECGASYRRITRSSGEVVWRCANRVEHGKVICHDSPTLPEQKVIEILCEELDLSDFDQQTIHERVDRVLVQSDGKLEVQFKQTQNMSFAL